MQRGYVKIYRKIQDSGLLQNGPALQLFLYLLTGATHKPCRKIVSGVVAELQAGQVVFGRIRAAKDLKLTERGVRTALKLLENIEIVTTKATSKFSVVTIINWHLYQDVDQQGDQQNDQQVTSKRPASDQQVTTRQAFKHLSTEEEKTEEGGDTSPTPTPISKPSPPRQKKTEPPKVSHGEYQRVKLTEDEYIRLEGKYGADILAAAITKLDLHIEAKGRDEYKCHAAAMQKWVFTAVEQDRQRGRASPATGSGGRGNADNRTWAQKREAEVMQEFLQGA